MDSAADGGGMSKPTREVETRVSQKLGEKVG